MAKHILHGPLDGLLKATYSDRDAEMLIRYDAERIELDEDDCDKLLRVIECAPSEQQAAEDLCEFFREVYLSRVAYRIALWFVANAHQIAKHVYADV